MAPIAQFGSGSVWGDRTKKSFRSKAKVALQGLWACDRRDCLWLFTCDAPLPYKGQSVSDAPGCLTQPHTQLRRPSTTPPYPPRAHSRSPLSTGRSWRHIRFKRGRAQTTLLKNTIPARSLEQETKPKALPTFRRSFGTTCPRSGSHLVHYENSTGGTTLDLRRSPQHPRSTQLIFPGLQDAVVQISAIFEGYDRTRLKVIIN